MRLFVPITLAGATALLSGAALRAAPPSTGPAVAETSLRAVRLPDGRRGCDITFSASNTGTQNLKLTTQSQVRSRPPLSPAYGTWKQLWSATQTIGPGKSWSKVVRMDFGCSSERQYRFRMTYAGNEKGFTVPSSGGTKVTSVSLGNLYTKFFD